MKFDIFSITGDVLFTADVNCREDEPESRKKRLAIYWAMRNGVSLAGANLTGAGLVDARLFCADLTGADLTGANLSNTHLSNTKLKGAQFDSALMDKVPVISDIHQKVYAAASQENALDMGNVHTCEATHCRAGWVTTLAGAAGKALERELGWSSAAALIYLKSDPSIDRVPDFHASDEDALNDMRVMAENEKLKRGE